MYTYFTIRNYYLCHNLCHGKYKIMAIFQSCYGKVMMIKMTQKLCHELTFLWQNSVVPHTNMTCGNNMPLANIFVVKGNLCYV